MRDNFYLELLAKQEQLLELTLREKDKYPLTTFKCTLAGIVIRMNTILEECLLNFHSSGFDDVSKLIYTCRQICIHYSSFLEFKDVEKTSLEIVKEFKKVFPDERKYFKKIMDFKKIKEENVVIKAGKKVIYDAFTNSYIFEGPFAKFVIDANKVTKIQELRKRKNYAYIINIEEDVLYYITDEEKAQVFFDDNPEFEIRDLFTANFAILGNNYNDHKNLILEAISNLYDNRYGAIYIKEQLPLDDKRQGDYLLCSKMLDKYFNDHIVYHQFLGDHLFVNMPRPIYGYYDYKTLKKSVKEDLENNLSSKDFFFIMKTIGGFDALKQEFNCIDCLKDEQKGAHKVALLLHWIDSSIRNLSKEFVEANKDFREVYLKLLSYRGFFAHNPAQLKDEANTSTLDDFYDISSGIVSVLGGMDFAKITKKTDPRLIKFAYMEKYSDDFITLNGEQYLRLNDTDYVGDRFYYASKENGHKKVVGLIPIDKHFDYQGVYFKKTDDTFTRQRVGKRGRIKALTGHDDAVDDELYMDVNLVSLLDIFAISRGRGEIDASSACNKQVVVFEASDYNNHKEHAMLLDNIIGDFFKLRYIPIELIREFNYEVINKGHDLNFVLKDKDNNIIGRVIGYNEYRKSSVKIDNPSDIIVNEVISVRRGK